MPEFAVIADLERHRTAVPIDHPDQSVTRTKLEYPTVDVSFIYLQAIVKVKVYGYGVGNQAFWFFGTVDSFTDKRIEGALRDALHHALRMTDGNNMYTVNLWSGQTNADFIIDKRVNGITTNLATEAVDIGGDTIWWVNGSISGSTIKGYRDSNPTTSPTLRISATDTTFASGAFGGSMRGDYGGGQEYQLLAHLRTPLSPLLTSVAVIEVEVAGSGTPEDPYRPRLSQNLVDIPDNAPDFLKLEKKKYDMLRSKGFTDDEIRLLLGYIPQHQVDLNSVTWGAFEFSEKSATNIIMVTGDNPYKPGAVQRQIDFAKSRGHRVFNAPKSYGDAVALYNKLKRDFPHWLAGKDNFAYQVLGFEELEPLAVIDFYYGELIEHRTHYDQIRRVPDWELRNTLLMWSERLERAKPNLPPDEYQKHREKLDKVLRLGW